MNRRSLFKRLATGLAATTLTDQILSAKAPPTKRGAVSEPMLVPFRAVDANGQTVFARDIPCVAVYTGENIEVSMTRDEVFTATRTVDVAALFVTASAFGLSKEVPLLPFTQVRVRAGDTLTLAQKSQLLVMT